MTVAAAAVDEVASARGSVMMSIHATDASACVQRARRQRVSRENRADAVIALLCVPVGRRANSFSDVPNRRVAHIKQTLCCPVLTVRTG